MAKKAKTFRLNEETIQMIELLAEDRNMTQVAVLEEAVKMFFNGDATLKLVAIQNYIEQFKKDKRWQ